ncbi:claudin-8-like [Pelobates cultripes]|uniref:Claudin n=1 Tax=Pelobates cultripes TaxID=61616 RepID=A0AAD1QY24_PELCU|nr:claudin-8-like [Pelobates cultripes]
MARFLVQIIGVICGGIGMILTWMITFMPQWRVSILAENNGFINNRVDGYWISRWDGLWTSCVNQARVSVQCNTYDSLVSVTSDLKSGRVLVGFALTMTIIAFIFSVVGMLFTQCNEERRHGKNCMLLTAGILYILSALLILIPVSWTTSNIVRQAYDASVCRGALRIEMGEALFLAWPTLVFLTIGGIMLCWLCSCRRKEHINYVLPRDQEMECRVVPEVCDIPAGHTRAQYL